MNKCHLSFSCFTSSIILSNYLILSPISRIIFDILNYFGVRVLLKILLSFLGKEMEILIIMVFRNSFKSFLTLITTSLELAFNLYIPISFTFKRQFYFSFIIQWSLDFSKYITKFPRIFRSARL